MSIHLNSLSGKLHISVSFSSFSGVLSCSFIRKVLSPRLPLCVCFCVLGISAASPGLEGMAVYRCLMGPSCESHPQSPEPGASGASPCVGCTYLPAVAGPRLLRGHWWAGLAPRPADCNCYRHTGAPWSRSCFGGAPELAEAACQVGWGRSRFGGAGPHGNSRMGCMVLARFMDSDRNGASQYQASQVEGE